MSFYETEYEDKKYAIPDEQGDSITRYVQDGILPGSFLQGIICNDLMKTFAHADSVNKENIPAYIMYFYWEVPADIWGSSHNMQAWITECAEARATKEGKP